MQLINLVYRVYKFHTLFLHIVSNTIKIQDSSLQIIENEADISVYGI